LPGKLRLRSGNSAASPLSQEEELMSTKLQGRPWTLDPIREVLAGTADPACLAERDRKGLTAVSFAALKAAVLADDLTALKALLEPTEHETNQVEILLDLVTTMAETLTELRRDVVSMRAELRALSQQRPVPGARASSH